MFMLKSKQNKKLILLLNYEKKYFDENTSSYCLTYQCIDLDWNFSSENGLISLMKKIGSKNIMYNPNENLENSYLSILSIIELDMSPYGGWDTENKKELMKLIENILKTQ